MSPSSGGEAVSTAKITRGQLSARAWVPSQTQSPIFLAVSPDEPSRRLINLMMGVEHIALVHGDFAELAQSRLFAEAQHVKSSRNFDVLL